MSGNNDTKSVVIATDDCEKALYIIAKDAMVFDILDIHFTEKYAPTVEYLLRMLRKGFGWMEQDRGTTEVENTKCLFNRGGFCTNKEITEHMQRMKCSESVRSNCKRYKRKFQDKINVNYVTIEKAGQIRNM